MNYLNKIFKCYNAYCLLLDKRIEFWSELHGSFIQKGIGLQRFLVGDGGLNEHYSHVDSGSLPDYYNGSTNYGTWYKSPAPLNAWLSHRKIIEKSLLEGFDHVLIIEDDVFIEDDFDEVLWKAEPFFIENKWDAVYFGGYHNENSWRLTNNDNVIKLQGSGGWHGVLLSRPIMEELMQELPIGPYDWIMGQKYHQKYDCYAIYPSVISQKSGHSYVENSNLDKPSRYKR